MLLAAGASIGQTRKPSPAGARFLGTMTNRFKQVNRYYAVPKGITDEKLIKLAEDLHKTNPDTQLWFLDDGSKWPAVMKFLKDYETNKADLSHPMADWLSKHTVASLQQFGFRENKHWVLAKGLMGNDKIADFK